ncbi:hypothetical protein Nm8I071_21790 [Nonomuraea sp. TT08I-71]|nr:hypothetical protein Nm8I071_21790 [Nonomuraea sp. TT08I-71]
MTTRPSATARVADASSYSATTPPPHKTGAGIALRSALFRIGVAEAKERTMHAHRRVSRPGQPPDGGA